MLTLFYRPVIFSENTNQATKQLLAAVASYQKILQSITNDVQNRHVATYNPNVHWRLRPVVTVHPNQVKSLIVATDAVAATLHFDAIDLSQRFISDCFNNTIVDILVQSVFDNTTIADDPDVRTIVLYWEQHVIYPVIEHLAATNNMVILGNEPLIGEAVQMELWAKYEGDPKRGMFQTLGSMLSKGFFRSLQKPAATPIVPSSFLGNLVAWGLHATDPSTRDAIISLLPILLDNPSYRPSIGVCTTLAAYEPGLKRVTIDLIRDNQLPSSDLRDIDVPHDRDWQNELLSLAKHIICVKDPITSD